MVGGGQEWSEQSWYSALIFEFATSYVHYWGQKVIDYAQQKGWQVVDLDGEAATADNFFSYLNTYHPDLILIATHGGPDRVVGQWDTPFLNSCENDGKLNGTPTYYLACLPPSEKIVSNPGVKTIQKINVGDHVLTHSGKFEMVTRTFSRPYSGGMVSLYLKGSNIPMVATPEHPILATRTKLCGRVGGTNPICKPRTSRCCSNCHNKSKSHILDWTRICDVDSGWAIAYPIVSETEDVKTIRISETFGNKGQCRDKCPRCYSVRYTKYGTKHGGRIQQLRCKDCGTVFQHVLLGKWILSESKRVWTQKKMSVPDEITINDKFMRIAGYFASEGSVSFGHDASISFGLHISETNIAEEIKSAFLEAFNLELKETINHNCRVLRVCCKPVAHLLVELFGENALHRRVPPWFLKLPSEKQLLFLDALFEGDAYKTHSERVLGVSSELLAFQVRTMLFRCGHIPYLYKLPNGKTINPVYKLRWSKHGRYNVGWIENNHVLFPVKKKVVRAYCGDVLNLEVEGHHSYCSLVGTFHNCLAGQKLGKTTFDKGAKMVVAYLPEFVWNVDPKYTPETDPLAAPFAEAAVAPILAMIDGLGPKEIYARVMKKYAELYNKWARDPSPDAAMVLTSLDNNKNGLIIYAGEGVITAPPSPILPALAVFGTVAAMALYFHHRSKKPKVLAVGR